MCCLVVDTLVVAMMRRCLFLFFYSLSSFLPGVGFTVSRDLIGVFSGRKYHQINWQHVLASSIKRQIVLSLYVLC